MELDYRDVLFASALLGLDEPRGIVDADNKTTRDLRVQGARVACLLDIEHLLDPGDDLMRG